MLDDFILNCNMCLFTVLYEMQMPSSDENFFCLSVHPSVC